MYKTASEGTDMGKPGRRIERHDDRFCVEVGLSARFDGVTTLRRKLASR
jgi:hypothetical protein